MAASGFTPIQLYRTSTAAAVPTAGDLADGELAINLTDEKLYFKNAAGTVKLLASNSGSLGTVTSVGGTGTVNGITLTGTVTSSGDLTLGGALSGVSLTTQVTGTLPVANGGTGITSLGAGVATFLGTPSSANLAAAVTDETGSGALVFATSPTLVTPALGTPSSATLTNATGLPISTGVSGLGTGVATFLATPSSANLAAAVTGETGSGALVFATSPSLVTPALGTPSSATLTNATGLPISTGVSGLGTGVATFLATPSSANLRSAVTDETGTGALVFATSPTLVTPNLGTPSTLVGTNITGTAAGLTAGNVTTNANLTGAVTSVGNATSLGSFTSANLAGALTDETGSGSAVFATSPTLVTPALGTPSSATLTNATGLPISTGVSGLGTGVATFLATPSSANLRTALTDETGTGSAVFATAPTLSGPVINDGYTEEVFAVTGTTPALSPTNGSIQTWTLSGNSTPTAGTWNAGQSLTLMVDDGTARTITWTSLAVTWKTNGGTAPTLNTTGYTVIQLWKVGSVIYGARVGDA